MKGYVLRFQNNRFEQGFRPASKYKDTWEPVGFLFLWIPELSLLIQPSEYHGDWRCARVTACNKVKDRAEKGFRWITTEVEVPDEVAATAKKVLDAQNELADKHDAFERLVLA